MKLPSICLVILAGVTAAGCSFDAKTLRVAGRDAAIEAPVYLSDAATPDVLATMDDAPWRIEDSGTNEVPPPTDASGPQDLHIDTTMDATFQGKEAGMDPEVKGGEDTLSGIDSNLIGDAIAVWDSSSKVDLAPVQDGLGSEDPDAPVIEPDASVAVDAARDTPIAPVLINLSQGKSTTASSQQVGKEAIFGNDDSPTSKFCPANMYFPVWWRVDLGAASDIARVDIAFEKPGTYYTYKIETSLDNATWSMAVDQSANSTRNGDLLSDTFTARARYVRITILSVSTTATWGCLLDFSVWGSIPGGSPAPVNLALSGTAYRWYGNSGAGSDTNKTLERRLNDNSTGEEFNLAGSGSDSWSAWEAAGILFPSATTFSSVVFVSGSAILSFSGVYDGIFAGNFRIQVSSNGTSWSDLTGWSVTPDYSMDYATANRAFVFSGSPTTARGVRVAGQVRLSTYTSSYAQAREVQVWGTEAASVPVGAAISLEAESLAVTSSSIGTYLSNDTCAASACTYVALNSGGSVGDYMEFTLPSIPAGSYELRLVYKGGPYRGIAQASFNGTAVGETFDQYMTATTQQLTWTPGSVVVGTAGNQTLRLSVTARNTNALGYTLTVDSISLTPL